MEIPTGILWEWDGSGSGNSLPTATLPICHSVIENMFQIIIT